LLVRARFPGWRSLLEGSCALCGHRYVQDLPSGHGLVYPTTLDLDTGDVFDEGGAVWFSSRLRSMWESPDGAPVRFGITVNEVRSRVVVLNCLDPIYGHSVFKLLNVQREIARDDGLGCVILITKSLAHLVPESVSEVWDVDEPTARLAGWLLELEERVDSELQRFDSCLLSKAFPHPHPSTYDIRSFVREAEDLALARPSVVLCLRDDRCWGRNPHAQARNVARFCLLFRRRFPDARCWVIGVGEPGGLPPDIRDLRCRRPSADVESAWLQAFAGADLVVGVHGSHMVLPSGLARSTIELLPTSRYGNIFQATLLSENDAMSSLMTHRTIYGNEHLSDIAPGRVCAIATSLLLERDRFHHLMRGPASGETQGEVPTIRASPKIDSTSHSKPDKFHRIVVTTPGSFARRMSQRGEGLRRRRTEWRLSRDARKVRSFPVVLADERGTLFEITCRDELESFLRHRGHFERDVLNFASSVLDAGMTAIDVGANVGSFTATFGRSVGNTGRVYAFEPLPSSYRRLLRNLELNGLSNVEASPLAVSDSRGEVRLFSYGLGFESWTTLAPRTIELPHATLAATEGETVESTTLDDYCSDHEIGKIDLLKIDVEGAELRVLTGAIRLLQERRIDAVVVEVSDNTLEAFGDSAYGVLELLEHHGVRPHVFDSGRLRPFRVAGKHRVLSNVIGLSASARARIGVESSGDHK
jgi:FkbM family methyltransferase